jgi:hypothetical protein
MPHKKIYGAIYHLPKNKMLEAVTALVKEQTNIAVSNVDNLLFSDKETIRKILLLFNVESCAKMDGYRFPFDRFKEESWDIEHIASQTDNSMQKTEDKIKWLHYLNNLTCNDEGWKDLKKEGLDLLEKLEAEKKDEGDKFGNIYKRIVEMIEPDDENAIKEKDSILNLTLLDAGTNRSYGNSLFPTKRKIILEKDKTGTFIPPCTKHIFLKYYTEDDKINSQWKNAWKQPDGEAYLEAIHKTIDQFLK